MKKTYAFIALNILFFSSSVLAQKISLDSTRQQCSNLTKEQRVRLAVSSFEVSTITNPGLLGDELAQLLTDALQNVNCFNVLLSTKDITAITNEQGFSQRGNNAVGGAKDKMKAAQVIVMGKVTSYAAGEKKAGALGITVSGGTKARISFVIQLINTETRELIASQPVTAEGKTGGLSGVKLLGLDMAGSTQTKAAQEACAEGIRQAVEFIAANRDKMPMPDASVMSAPKNQSEINVLKTDYSKFKALVDLLSTKGKIIEKSISNGNGYMKLDHAGSSVDQIVDLIDSKLGSRYAIKEFGENGITLEGK